MAELPLGAERPLTGLLVRLGTALDEARLYCRLLRVEGEPLGIALCSHFILGSSKVIY